MENGLSNLQSNAILRALKKHHKKILDISDTLYQDVIRFFIKEVDDFIDNNFEVLNDSVVTKELSENLIEAFLKRYTHQDINSIVLRGVFYETILSD